MTRFRLLSLALAILVAAGPARAKVRNVVLISVDGLGRDLLNEVDTPHMLALARAGAIAARAETVDPPRTIPAHVTMVSGVPPARHGRVAGEREPGLAPADVPTLFDLGRSRRATTVAVFGKEKLQYVLSREPIDRVHRPELFPFGELWGRNPIPIEDAALSEVAARPELLFVHYALPDTIGHWFHWKGWAQRLSLRLVDASIGRLIRRMNELWTDGSYAVIVTADHGGHEGAHGRYDEGGRYDDRDISIPWILTGASLKDPAATVGLEDTAPTIANLLGWRVPPDWRWTGNSVAK